MKVSIKLDVWTSSPNDSPYGRESGEQLFTVLIEEDSAKKAEERIGLLSQAVTHMGWKLK